MYYSCDTKLRGWVPPPVYVLLGKTALRQATTWVHKEAMQARAAPDRAAPAAERSHQPPACSQEGRPARWHWRDPPRSPPASNRRIGA